MDINEKIELIENDNIDDKNILINKISKLFSNHNLSPEIIFPNNVLNDLDILNDIFNKINNTNTLYGEYILSQYLSNPIKNYSILKQRQNNIKKILKNPILSNNIQNRFDNIKSLEEKILWFWNDITEDVQSLYDMIYFKLPFESMDKFLNNSELILNILNVYKIFLSPICTIFIPLISFILPYILVYFFNKDISFTMFIKFLYKSMTILPISGKTKIFSLLATGIYIFFYLQSGYYSIQNAMNIHKIINILHKKISYVSLLIQNVNEIFYITNKLKIKLITDITNDLHYFNNLFKNFDTIPKLFNNKGKILSIYNQFLYNKDRLINILYYIGEIDYYTSLCKLYQKHKYCLVNYMKSDKPVLYAKNMWHPSLTKNIHTNNMYIGDKDKNLLITGPNRSGKSVFIKSMAISVLFAQSLTITPATKFIITPFSLINSYLHIPDVTGYASLFEAEMYRAREHLKILNNIKGKSFIIMDEIFTSTNYIEGYSAAYAIIKKLCKYNNSVTIVTTHYTELNNLDKVTNISNYKFDNYKIKRGYSDKYIALELLKNNNFDIDIILDAVQVSKELKLRLSSK